MGLFDSNKTTTTSQTTNNDNRQVITTTSSNYDLSNRSTNSTVNNFTDGGAIAGMVTVVGKALDGASAQTLSAYNYADSIFSAANVTVNNSSKRLADAYSAAASMSRDALVTAQAAYKDANRATADAQSALADAYADAKGTTNSQKQIIIGVLVVAGVLAMATMSKRS